MNLRSSGSFVLSKALEGFRRYIDALIAIKQMLGEMLEMESALPLRWATGNHARCAGNVLGNQPIIGQRRLRADIRTGHQEIGNQEGMGNDFLIGRRQSIQPPSQLLQLACADPARQLPADIVWINLPREEQACLKQRLIGHQVK